MNYKVVFSLFLTLNAFGLNEYTSTKNAGMNKYQRIGEIESYLEKLSVQIPKDFDTKIQNLQLQVDQFKKNDSSEISQIKKDLEKLKQDFKQFETEQKSKLEAQTADLNKKLEDHKKDTGILIDSLRSSLETKILVIEKIIANFGKVEIK